MSEIEGGGTQPSAILRFSRKEINITTELDNYILQKVYNKDTIDLVFAGLCNMLAMVHQVRDDKLIDIEQNPGREGVKAIGTIYILLRGSQHGVHYDAIVPLSAPNTQYHHSTQSI